jgi:hypothetical protein
MVYKQAWSIKNYRYVGDVSPYIVTEVIPGRAYRLQGKKTGKDESNPWNAEQL